MRGDPKKTARAASEVVVCVHRCTRASTQRCIQTGFRICDSTDVFCDWTKGCYGQGRTLLLVFVEVTLDAVNESRMKDTKSGNKRLGCPFLFSSLGFFFFLQREIFFELACVEMEMECRAGRKSYRGSSASRNKRGASLRKWLGGTIPILSYLVTLAEQRWFFKWETPHSSSVPFRLPWVPGRTH